MEAFEAGLADLGAVRPKQSRCENCLPEEPELEAELGLGEDGNSEGEAGDEGEVLSQTSEAVGVGARDVALAEALAVAVVGGTCFAVGLHSACKPEDLVSVEAASPPGK